jgi:hypothetical protein
MILGLKGHFLVSLALRLRPIPLTNLLMLISNSAATFFSLTTSLRCLIMSIESSLSHSSGIIVHKKHSLICFQTYNPTKSQSDNGCVVLGALERLQPCVASHSYGLAQLLHSNTSDRLPDQRIPLDNRGHLLKHISTTIYSYLLIFSLNCFSWPLDYKIRV